VILRGAHAIALCTLLEVQTPSGQDLIDQARAPRAGVGGRQQDRDGTGSPARVPTHIR